jgi:hypothetical protein
MVGLVRIAAPPKLPFCAREGMLRQQWLWTQKAGLSASYQFVRRATNVRFPPFVSIDANGPNRTSGNR